MNVNASAASLYLDKSEEMQVALHLSACELKIVFLLPAVMMVDRETLVELGEQEEEKTKGKQFMAAY